MRSEELVRAWKGLDYGRDGYDGAHPAGHIAIDAIGEGLVGAATVACTVSLAICPTNVPTMWECCATPPILHAEVR